MGVLRRSVAAMPRLRRLAVAGLCALVPAACSTIEPEIASHVRQPDEPPERTFTSFSDSLRCMDDLLLAHGSPGHLITSTGFPDRTNSVRVAADDMLVSAVGLMNARSQSYVFIDQALEKDWGQVIYLTEKPEPQPTLYIRGAISQYDKKTVEEEFKLPFLFFGINPVLVTNGKVNGGRAVSVISVDMHLVQYPDRLVVPGSSVSNSMVLVDDGLGAGLEGIIGQTEYDFTISMDRIESPGQAVRNLIELGVIELLGRHAGIPYWQCLAIDRTQEENLTTEQETWWAKAEPLRTAGVQAMLEELGYLAEYEPGTHDMITRRAIARFQQDNRLIATGNVDYDLDRRLREMTGKLNRTTFAPPGPAPDQSLLAGRFGGETGERGVVGLAIEMLGTPPGGYGVGDRIRFRVTVEEDAHVTCYYRPAAGGVFRIFPDQGTSPALMRAGESVIVPGELASFDILLDTPGVEERILCVGETARSGAELPPEGQGAPLAPLAVEDLRSVLQGHQSRSEEEVGHVGLAIRTQRREERRAEGDTPGR